MGGSAGDISGPAGSRVHLPIVTRLWRGRWPGWARGTPADGGRPARLLPHEPRVFGRGQEAKSRIKVIDLQDTA